MDNMIFYRYYYSSIFAEQFCNELLEIFKKRKEKSKNNFNLDENQLSEITKRIAKQLLINYDRTLFDSGKNNVDTTIKFPKHQTFFQSEIVDNNVAKLNSLNNVNFYKKQRYSDASISEKVTKEEVITEIKKDSKHVINKQSNSVIDLPNNFFKFEEETDVGEKEINAGKKIFYLGKTSSIRLVGYLQNDIFDLIEKHKNAKHEFFTKKRTKVLNRIYHIIAEYVTDAKIFVGEINNGNDIPALPKKINVAGIELLPQDLIDFIHTNVPNSWQIYTYNEILQCRFSFRDLLKHAKDKYFFDKKVQYTRFLNIFDYYFLSKNKSEITNLSNKSLKNLFKSVERSYIDSELILYVNNNKKYLFEIV